MNIHEHIILRADGPRPDRVLGDRFSGRAGSIDPLPGERLSVTAETLSKAELGDVLRDPSVRATAPSLPVRLIAQVSNEVSQPTLETAAGPTWGVRAVRADASRFDGSGVTVAILDTGIDRQHVAFAGMANRIVEADFSGTGDGDHHGHGTHVAGTVFGQDVGGVRIGVARGIRRALIGKVLNNQGGGTTAGICNGILWADAMGADVISMSLGIDFPGAVEGLRRQGYPTDIAGSLVLEAYRANVRVFDTIAASLRARAMLGGDATAVCAAAGNESRRNEDPRWEVGTAPPAAADGVVSVAAVGSSDNGVTYFVAPFSNTGANIAAPGVRVQSARAGTPNDLVSYDGTSMATPHVAGVLALWADKLKRQEGAARHGGLLSRVLGTARPLPGLDPLDLGQGLVQAPLD